MEHYHAEVCSPDYALKLKNFGVKQESPFWWTSYVHKGVRGKPETRWELSKNMGIGNSVAAITITELFKLTKGNAVEVYFHGGKWNVQVYGVKTISKDSLPDALAELVLKFAKF